jgi:hypothetical protein
VAEQVLMVVVERVGARMRGAVGVRREDERRTTRPAPNHLRSQAHGCFDGIRGLIAGCFRNKAPEALHVLLELAEHEVAAVDAKAGLTTGGCGPRQ